MIGERACIGAGSVVGAGVSVGDDVVLHANVTIYDRCVIGPRTVVHSGAVIGADGFGMAQENGRWLKIPQIGRVVIGADVEIGANTTIDRGAIDDTVIENDVKLDNLIQIGHNCRIGAHTAIAGCAGIAGSTRVGRNCLIGGAAMINGHIEIGDGVVIDGAAQVRRSIETPGEYAGLDPALPGKQWRRIVAVINRLPEVDETRPRVWRRCRYRWAGRAADAAKGSDESERALCDGYPGNHAVPAASIPVPARRSHRRARPEQVDPRHQERDDERAVLPGPFPRLSGDARGAHDRSARPARVDSRVEDLRPLARRRDDHLLRDDRQCALPEAGAARRPARPRGRSAEDGARSWQICRPREGRRRNRRRSRPDGGDALSAERHEWCLTRWHEYIRPRSSTRPPSLQPMSRSALIRSSARAVRIGPGSVIGPHVVITGRTSVGARNRVFQFTSIGEIPQDRKYGGEPTTTTIGDDNVFREFVTIHAGTAQDRGDTSIGNGNLFLAYTHVAHDCVVGNSTVFSNNAQIAGHVRIGDWVVLGGIPACTNSAASAHTHARRRRDRAAGRAAFVTARGYPAKPHGTNSEGLRRRGSPPKTSSRCAARTRRSTGRTLARRCRAALAGRQSLARDCCHWSNSSPSRAAASFVSGETEPACQCATALR